MPSITSTGVGSGLDVNSIVTQLMTLEQRPLTQLQRQSSDIQTQLSAFGSLKGAIAALGDVATRLADPANWNPVRVDSSDSSSVTATGSATAASGRHSLEISQLAQAQTLASGAYAGPTSVVGTGTLTIELGTTVGNVFTPKSGGTPTTVTIDSSHQTLSGVRDAINASNAGVTASIVTSGGVSKLVLRGQDGAENAFRITTTDGDGQNTDASGLSALAYDPAAAVGAGKNLSCTQSAQDALYKLDGIDLTSATNSPADVLDGLSLNFKAVTTSAVTITAATDPVQVRKNVNDFVKAYNDLNKLVRSQTQSDPSASKRGTLQGDSTAVSVLNSMRQMLQGTVSGLTGANSLSTAGIDVARDGSLSINETRFAPLLATPGKLASLFAQASSKTDPQAAGFGLRLRDWANALDGDTGILASRTEGLNKRQTQNDKQQSAMQDRLDRTEARLRAQYQALDTNMSNLKAQLNSLSQLTSSSSSSG